jgi:hypothetical protein
MGVFDDVLICSDYDNTLTYKDQFSGENAEAIKRFRENGGTFVMVTGRGYNGTEFFDPVLKADGYLVVNNGTVLYKNDKVIETIPLDDNPMKIAKQVFENKEVISSFGVYWVEGTERYYTDDISFDLEKINMENVTKFAFFCDTEEQADMLFKKEAEKFGDSYSILKSLPDNFEIFSKNGGKGKMALELKEKLKKKILVCMGDYDSDISMLEVADISFAPSNATQNVKNISDYIVQNSQEGIMNDVMEILKENVGELAT